MNARILERTPRMKMMKVTTRFGDTSSSTTKLGSIVRSFFILAQDSSGGRVNLNHQELGENQLYLRSPFYLRTLGLSVLFIKSQERINCICVLHFISELWVRPSYSSRAMRELIVVLIIILALKTLQFWVKVRLIKSQERTPKNSMITTLFLCIFFIIILNLKNIVYKL